MPFDPYILFCGFLVAFPVAVFLHELGHVVASCFTGFVVTSFGLGSARPWLVVDVRGVKVYSCLVRPLQGITFALHPDLYPSRFEWVVLPRVEPKALAFRDRPAFCGF